MGRLISLIFGRHFYFFTFSFLLLAVAVSAESVELSLGNIVKMDSCGEFHDRIFLEGRFDIGEYLFADCGALIEADGEYAAVFVSTGVEDLFNFLAVKMRGTYNAYPGKPFSELTAAGTLLAYCDILELELGLGYRHLYNVITSGQNIGDSSWAYRLRWNFLNLDRLRMSAELGNLESFQLNNVSDIALKFVNRLQISPQWAAGLDLTVHNTGAWAFSSYYSGFELCLNGVYCL